MANRFPLIVNTTSGNSVQELPSGDFLDLSSSGIANSGNITVNASSFFIGNGSQLTGITSSYGNANVVANLAALGSNPVSTTANVTGGNILTGGLISATSTVTGSSLLGSVASLSGNVTGGNILTGGLISATSTVTTAAGITATGNITGGNVLTGGLISAASTVTGTSHLGAVVSVTGNVTAANVIINGTAAAGSGVLIVSGNIQTTSSNATANIGNTTNYFNTIFGKATTAQYADLAELYSSDAVYLPGTVLDFGGSQEVTLSTQVASNKIAGVVSTNPAHLMNSTLDSDHKVAVALTGRVPTSVVGTVRKGDMMVSAGNGHAQASATPAMGTVIGKALENFDGASGVIEIVVGRL